MCKPTAAQDGGRLDEAKAKPLNSEPRFQNMSTITMEVVIETYETHVMATSHL